MRQDLLGEHARDLAKMPEEWAAYRFEAISNPGSREVCTIRIDGAVAPAITRGKRKGQPNWAKMQKESRRTVYFTPEEHQEWCRRWEERTGKCSVCQGKKVVLESWSAKDGCRYKPCPACGGTGSPAVNSGKTQENLK